LKKIIDSLQKNLTKMTKLHQIFQNRNQIKIKKIGGPT